MDSQATESKSWIRSNNQFDLNDCLDIPLHGHGFLEHNSDGYALQIAELCSSDSYRKFKASLNIANANQSRTNVEIYEKMEGHNKVKQCRI